MCKRMPTVNFHYGKKEFENLMVYILNIKLKELNLKIIKEDYTITDFNNEVKR
ncbi:hypothetical protein G8S49_07125 [Clostridium botulinum C]|uniref:Uncharacterized protein n=2 Tax=Clostridium botulinum TaxID=1491 RepID=A0A9P2G940_CLOBO|nr:MULTISPECIES: hypothetical protein [Clostridium]EES92270.1 hypothetical protein CLG_B0248 [Clostridium botulinum D str. 1873]MBO3442511.1 hypothetical protein [Clostridium haemolyticum]MCD3195013.1 hypothetical protein [Clostridium botulinum C]MCD3200812.1 hypothetical protein [Clostridium botulinum C]MCD3206220.1 hypothetical protein [Clostridium botulinum C]